MGVVIRLKRIGTTQRSRHRIVISNSRMPRDGRFIECIGSYDPSKESAQVEIDKDRALHWLKNGAKPSETVSSLFRQKGIIK